MSRPAPSHHDSRYLPPATCRSKPAVPAQRRWSSAGEASRRLNPGASPTTYQPSSITIYGGAAYGRDFMAVD